MSKTDISLVVPLYNESENIEEIYLRIKSELCKLSLKFEIVFVDDGSVDGTSDILKEIKRKEPNIKLVIFDRNYGQTEAMAAGFEYAGGDIIITMDGDLQNDPADILPVIIKLQSGYDLVCGWRKARKDRFLSRRLPSMIANAIISFITKVSIHDLGCSLKGFRRELVENIHLYSDMHRYIPIIASSIGANIAEIPVTHRARAKGDSKYGLSRSWKVIIDLLKIKVLVDFSSRPLALFSWFSLPFLFLGLVFWAQYFLSHHGSQVLTYSFVLQGTGTLYLFLAFSLLAFGFVTQLIIKTGDLKSDKIINSITGNV